MFFFLPVLWKQLTLFWIILYPAVNNNVYGGFSHFIRGGTLVFKSVFEGLAAIFTGVFIFETVSFGANGWIRLGLACGGALGGLFLFNIVWQKLSAVIKKQSPSEVFVKLANGLGGLLTAYLMVGIIRPVLAFMTPVQAGALILVIVLGSVLLVKIIGTTKTKELCNLFFNPANPGVPKPASGANPIKILDTSAIIDGRIADLCKTHFLEGGLVIPSFILVELQKIADSADPLRRNRGRRGLDLLNKIQKENQIPVKVFERDYEDVGEVDTKLLRLAMELGAKVITNDFNLNKVAELYGVQVLNINELANAIKPVVLPGEEMMVYVLRDGKEYGQGIGYLEDGTMIVIEGGKNYIGMNIEILVTSVLQTSAGRMIFAKPREAKDYILSKASSETR